MSNFDWLNCIPEGWESIAKEMINKCEEIDPSYEIFDMKEKYGSLRIYSNTGSEKIIEIEQQYESISSKICCRCGKPATKISTGWILPFCDNCVDRDEKFYKSIKE